MLMIQNEKNPKILKKKISKKKSSYLWIQLIQKQMIKNRNKLRYTMKFL